MKLGSALEGVVWTGFLVQEMSSFATHLQKWSGKTWSVRWTAGSGVVTQEVERTQEKTGKVFKKILLDLVELTWTTAGLMIWAHDVRWICLTASGLYLAELLAFGSMCVLGTVYVRAIFRRSVELLRKG